MSNEKELLKLDDYRRVFCGLLSRQVRLIDVAIHSILKRDEFEGDQQVEVQTILLMLQGMGVSAHSILNLSQTINMGVRDCYGIARTVVETGINIAYIVAGGSDTVQKARRHAEQKTFRDLNRTAVIGPFMFKAARLGPLPDASAIPGLKEALDEFTNKKGREIRSWTNDNIDDRLHQIEERFPGGTLLFAGALAQVYRYSSEILHGTYFGSIYFWTGGSKRPSNRAETEWVLFSTHLVSVISACLFAIRAVIEILERHYGMVETKEENARILELLVETVEEHLVHLSPEDFFGPA